MNGNTAVANPVDVDLFSNLHNDTEVQTSVDKHTETDAVIRKCLHPPSAVPEFCGIPTNDARTQVVVEWRDMEIMNAPRVQDLKIGSPTYNTVIECGPENLQTYDYGFIIPNGARVKHIGYVRNNTAPERRMMQDLAGVAVEQLYNFKNWKNDANLYRPVAKSTTLYPNMTMFNNTGMVTGNQFNPNILFAGTLIGMVNDNPALFYSIVKSMIRVNQVKVTRNTDKIERWLQIPHHHRVEVLKRLNLSPTEHLDLDPNTTHQIILLGKLSTAEGIQNFPSSSQILGNSLRSYGGKASEGAFSIQRLNTISPSWLAGTNTFEATIDAEISGLYQCWTAEVEGTGTDYFLSPLYENMDVGQNFGEAKSLYDTLWSKDMTWSFVLFSGLSLNPQTNAMTNLLIKKTISIYEVQPCLASAWAGMIKLGPKPNLMVMQAMMDGFYELKDVLPARYNFWGTLASMASNGLATFGTSLLSSLAKRVMGGKSNKGGSKPKPNPSKIKPNRNTPLSAAPQRKSPPAANDIQAFINAFQRMGGNKQTSNRKRRGNNRRRRQGAGQQLQPVMQFAAPPVKMVALQ